MQIRRFLFPATAVLVAALGAACSELAPTALVPGGGGQEVRNGNAQSRNAAALRRGGPSRSLSASASSFSPAIIDNSVIQLGIHPEGHLNVAGGTLSTGTDPTTFVGLRLMTTNSEATAPGCLCEGWGAADALSGVTGWANEDYGGAHNLEVESFTHTASTAVSTVLIRNRSGDPWMRVAHDYHPSPATPNLYEVTVTVENLSGQTIDLRYRRVMDWDIAPNTFSEYSTIQGTAAAEHVLFASNDGFASADPLSHRSDLGHTGDFVDAGPNDHGALFDFGFGLLEAGQSKTFTTFYGAAANEADANFALTQAGAEVYSLGQASYDGRGWTPVPYRGAGHGSYGAETGEPNTFIFAFRSVGGDPAFKPLDITLYISPDKVSLSRTNTLSVWVPSTPDFDATKLVPSSATLGNESDPEARIATRPNGTTWYATGDFNRDGLMDMMLVFLVADLKANGDLKAGTDRLVLRASHQVEGLVRAGGPLAVFP